MEIPRELHLYVPDEQEAGSYAEVLSVWHTAYALVLDFLVPQFLAEDEESAAIPVRLVSRVRIPVGYAFEAIRTINAEMTDYEAQWGEIRPPEPTPGDRQ